MNKADVAEHLWSSTWRVKLQFYSKDRLHAKDFMLLNSCLMSYLYTTARIFPHPSTTFAVLADALLESVLCFTFVSNWNLFFSNSAIKNEVLQLASLMCDYILIVQYKFILVKTLYRIACILSLKLIKDGISSVSSISIMNKLLIK